MGQPIGLHRRVTQSFQVGSRTEHMVWDLMVPNDFPGDQFRRDLLTGTFKSWWTTGFFGYPPANIFFTSSGSFAGIAVHAPRLPDLLRRVLEFELQIGLAGGVEQPALPQNCTVAVGLATGFPGPSLRGRKFFPGLVDVANDSDDPGYLRPGVCMDLTACFFGLIRQFLTLAEEFEEGWAVCIFNALRPGTGGGFPTGLVPVNGVRMSDNVLDSQWRRLPNHRHHARK